jgi:hypothetical protein
MRTIALLLAVIGLGNAQQLKLNLDHLAAKAADSIDISLNASMLQFAAKFLDGKDPDEAKIKKLIVGIDSIAIRSFEFKADGEWAQSDLEGVRSQLKAPGWSRLLGFKSASEGESAEVHVFNEKEKIAGVAIVITAPREFTVVNLTGAIDMDSLAELSGHFGMPKIEPAPKPQQRKME